MALGWLSALKVVPWSDVISNAPMVADGAKKLWGAVAKKAGVSPVNAQSDDPADPSTPGPSLELLDRRITNVSNALIDLQSQMATSSQLISTLADQNAQLIARLDKVQRRSQWLTYLLVLISVLSAGILIWLAYPG